ncbi:MAG: cupin domain-containing protein [Acidimicrobiales bacterium]
MKIVSGVESKPAYEGCFSGDVRKEGLKSAVGPTDSEISVFHYEEGAVSKWHSHPGGQSLYVLSDSAIVGDDHGVRSVHRGDLVVTQPNERHFHGATPGSATSLLTITLGVTRWEDEFPTSRELGFDRPS